MPSYKLHYFNIRGRAEVARMIMAYGGIDYEDVRYTGEEWAEFKPKTPFGQMPVLEVDGKMMAQSGAICDYLGKQAGLLGKDDMETAMIRMIGDQCEDGLKPLIGMFMEKDEAKKAELKKKYEEEDLPKFLGSLEKFLESNKSSGHFVGDKITVADIKVTFDLTWPQVVGVTVDMDKYPKLKGVMEAVNTEPKIAAWIAKRPKSDM